MKSKLVSLCASSLLVLFSGSAPADDTDIYYGKAAVAPGAEPIVMFSLDWRPNLGSTACNGNECDSLIAEGYLPNNGPYTFFDVLRAVLKKTMEPLEGVRIGLMLNHDYQNNCANDVSAGCSNGGYIALGAELFELGDGNGAKARFHQFLADMPVPQGNASHAYQGKELFFELYRYLSGQAVWNGHVGFLDYESNVNRNLDQDNPEISWDTSVESGGNYISPLTGAFGSCSRLYTVNIMFQVSQQEDNSDSEIRRSVADGGMNINPKQFPEVIEWLNDVDLADGAHGTVPDIEGNQNVTSYFIVDPTKINQTTGAYAQAGGTGVPLALSDDPDELVATLQEVFKQIISVSTTFVAASVPVNTFNRAEIEDNVFIALFQVDADGKPVWEGNVKKLRITGLTSGLPAIVDATGTPAFAPDGRLRYDAVTYWTDTGALPAPDPDENEVAGADGRSVARGGAGQKIPGVILGSIGDANGAATRQLFYDNGGALAPLDVSAAASLAGDLNAANNAEAAELIRFARGQDVDDLDLDANTTEAREWLVADILHSRPLPLNYGARGGYTEANPAIFIAAGSNDGYMRLIRSTNTDGTESGEEVWGFMPRSVMDKLKINRTNALGDTHQYTVDGAPVAYLEDLNGNGTIDIGEKAYLFFGLRRGGRAIYALDVSDPEAPQLLWSIDKSGDFAELGYTFGEPRVIVTSEGGTRRPALVFNGGYDLNKDIRAGVGTDDSEGNALYVVEMDTGALIWKAVGSGAASLDTFLHPQLVDSIPASLARLDSDGDGDHDRLYVGDSGGNVWRADIEGPDKGDWKLTLLARLGRHAYALPTKAEDRRFFHRPDVVQAVDGDEKFDAVVLGSGDRADPKDAGGTAQNYTYMIRDRNIAPGSGVDSALTHTGLTDVTNLCLTGDCTVVAPNGWALQLSANGEKQLSKPVTILGTVFFTTYLPDGGAAQGACAPSEGSGRLYSVSLLQGAPTRNYDTTTEDLERWTDLDSSGIPAEVVPVPDSLVLRPDGKFEETGATTRIETYWFEQEDSDL